MLRLFKHVKSGKVYELVDSLIIDATNAQPHEDTMVLYREEDTQAPLFVRTHAEFFDGRFREIVRPFSTRRSEHAPRT